MSPGATDITIPTARNVHWSQERMEGIQSRSADSGINTTAPQFDYPWTMWNNPPNVILALALLFILPTLLPAQNISCALSGTVQDPGGAVMAGVKVTLTGQDNGFVRSAFTTGEGYFSFPHL